MAHQDGQVAIESHGNQRMDERSDWSASKVAVVSHPPVANSRGRIYRAREKPTRTRLVLAWGSLVFLAGGLVANIVVIATEPNKDVPGLIGGAIVSLVFIVLFFPWLVRHIRRKRLRQYSVTESEWMSRLGFFFGPFDDSRGLNGSSTFLASHSPYGRAPQTYLIAREHGLSIAAASKPWDELAVQSSDISQVDLFRGTRKRMVWMSSSRATDLGKVQISTIDGRRAVFAGTTIEPLRTFFEAMGVSVRPSE
jgi:hypothetical protein